MRVVINVTSDNIPHFENNFTHVELDYFTHEKWNWMMWQEGTKWPGDEMTGDEMTRGRNDRDKMTGDEIKGDES
jgi:hypothetical protein